MKAIKNSRCASLALLTAVMGSVSSHAAEVKIWSDAEGLQSVPFCEANHGKSVVDPRFNEYLSGTFTAADGSQWRVSTENGSPSSVDCLHNERLKNYVVFEVRAPGSATAEFIGVHAEEMSVLEGRSALKVSAKVAAASEIPAGVQVQTGALDYVVCISGSTLNVRDQALNKVLFTVGKHAPVKPVQSFGTDRLKKKIDGVEYTFIKAEFPKTPAPKNVGWVAEKYVVTRTECPGVAQPPPAPAPVVQAWTFPTVKRPSTSYKEGMRRFKASRSGGRLHAACDLYRTTNEDAVSVTSGTVIRDKYYFYEGTYAIEVKHTGGKVARYGEITGKSAPGIAVNKTVKTNQTIGYIGKVNSGCCTPMLHFELYAGTASGALSQSGNSFQRRKDLIDPSKLLSEWEKSKFGASY